MLGTLSVFMLLTLAAGSLRSLVAAEDGGAVSRGKGKAAVAEQLTLLDMPAFAVRELDLRGLNVPASMLSGWGLEDLDALRDAADKAACPCLVLNEDAPLPLGDPDAATRERAAERVSLLAMAAQRMGCSAVSLMVAGPDSEEAIEDAAAAIKSVMPSIERGDLNVLIAPCDGLTSDPDRLTDLIKKIGGFRIGSLPTFGDAAKTRDVIETLRKLAPYAGAIHATVCGFSKKGEHKGYDLAACVTAIKEVGFVNTLAIDYIGRGNAVKDIDAARTILNDAIEGDKK